MPFNPRPEFEVERITGQFSRPISRIVQDVKEVGHLGDKKKIVTNRIEHDTEMFTDGYMLYFPQGHSMMVAADDTDTIRRLGILRDPRVVDMESGEVVPDGYLSNKELVARRESNRPRPSTGGLTNIEQEL